MTDVPGHTLGLVPLLAEAGIRFLHIGVNSASTPPDVPPVFRWRTAHDEEIIVMYQNEYGTTLLPDGMDHGIGFAHTMDNMGPQSVSQVVESHRLMANDNPGARIQASTLTEFGNALWAQRELFPIVESEIADSWIHGVGTAPKKVARYMSLRRLYDEWVCEGLTPLREVMGRRLGLIAEHTWGVDIKTFLRDEVAWDRAEFKAARQSDPRFALTEKSWQEQEAFIDDAIDVLDPEDQSVAIRASTPITLKASSAVPSKQGSLAISNGVLDFDPQTGFLSSVCFPSGHTLSTISGSLGTLSYESYDAGDYQAYEDSYLTHHAHWAILDHGKPGLAQATTACSDVFRPQWQGVACDADHVAISYFRFAGQAADELGAPKDLEIRYRFTDPDTLEITVCFFGKPANRMPEASFISFSPDLDPGSWRFSKMGYSIDPKNVINLGNKQLHAVESVQAMTHDGLKLSISPRDSPLVGPVDTPFLAFYRGSVSMDSGVKFNLHNNKWGTNFPMWCSGDLVFRFDVTLVST